MKIRRAALQTVAGVIAAGTVPMVAQAQTSTVTMGISMSLATLATASQTALNFGTVAAAPTGGNIAATFAAGSTVSTVAVAGGGLAGGVTNLATAGTLAFNRSVAIKAIVTVPASAVTMSCPGGAISVGSFTAVSSGTATTSDCGSSGATLCTFLVGATATLPAGLTTGSCTAGSASFTVQYQ
jgi:hypothetical protein